MQKLNAKRFFSGIKNPPQDTKLPASTRSPRLAVEAGARLSTRGGPARHRLTPRLTSSWRSQVGQAKALSGVQTQLPYFQTQDRSPEDILPTTVIIELAKRQGVDFGPGNPEERIRYFIKLGILPHASRKTPQNNKSANPVGHLPLWTIKRLIWVTRLSQAGNSYPQIAQKLENQETKKSIEEITRKPARIEYIPPVHSHLPLLAKIVLISSLVPILIFAVVSASLMFGGQNAAQFLKAGTYESANVLGTKSSSLSLYSKIYGASSDFFSTVLRPFVNLAEVMMNGSKTEINYAFNVPSKAQVTNAERLTTNASYLPLAADGSINVDGQATFNSLLKAASLSAGALSVSGSTT
ncbi:MAG: hypothetical protein Q7S45_00100, partial [Candidatus Curtissbacteria bacterium]|nr:hypothetical protein [Candidatus Curtissbacteria bacterium]